MDSQARPLKILEEQIESCQKLLAVFQEERGIYNQGRSLSKEELASTLERKLQLVNLFEKQRQVMKAMPQEEGLPEELKSLRKTMLRNLAALLEQLIIIDQDNERLMREAATTTRRPQALSPFAARQRPALQMQLPLMPFGQAAMPEPKATAQPKAATAAAQKIAAMLEIPAAAPATQQRQELRAFKAPAAGGALPLRPKSHLRVYGPSHAAGAAANA